MSCIPNLIVAGVEIPVQAFPAAQSYSRLVGETLKRKLDGTGVKQSHWSKLATTITGDGWLPPALAGVDWSAAVTISCIHPRMLNSATNTKTIPTARRSDTSVTAFAIVAGEAVSTPCVLATNTATATAVAGATAYQFMYYPQLSCYSSGPEESLDTQRGVYQWTLQAEEA